MTIHDRLDLYMDDGHHMSPVDISSKIPSILEITTGKIRLTVEIIRILILLRLGRERDEAPIEVEALGPDPVGPLP
ncbi:hypothetical protein TNCV_2361571 [Trichonephila clavipes]|nr:hypothetical protein TNCV_2361571 [Trichonephila clavipes]